MSLNNLFNLIRQEDVCLWIGSGFSRYAGYPSSMELKQILYSSLTSEEKQSVDEHLPLPDFTDLFVRIKGGSRNNLLQILRNIFLKKPSATDLHDQISHIPHFKSIITTNYDELIEHSYSTRCAVLRDSRDIPLTTRQLVKIYKVHGDFSLNNLIITKDDYSKFNNLDFKDPYWASIVTELTTKNVVFLGYGFEDSNFWAVFDSIDHYVGQNRKQRFFVAPNIDNYKQQHLTSRGIEYINLDGDQFLNDLSINLKENIIDDFKNKKVSVETFTSYLGHHDLEVSIEIKEQVNNLISLKKINGIAKGNLTLSLSDQYQDRVENFMKGQAGRLLVLPKNEINNFETTVEGFKMNPNFDDVEKILIQFQPALEKKFSISFPKENLEIENLKFQAFRLQDKLELATVINGFAIEILAPVINKQKINFSINVKLPEKISTSNKAVEVYRALFYFSRGDVFKIFLEGSGDAFEYKLDPTPFSKHLEDSMNIYIALQKIERFFDVKFTDFDLINEVNLKVINQLTSLIDNQYFVERSEEGIQINCAPESVFQKKIPNNSSLLLQFAGTNSVKLLGKDFDLGTREIEIPKVFVKRNGETAYFKSKDKYYVYRFAIFGLTDLPPKRDELKFF